MTVQVSLSLQKEQAVLLMTDAYLAGYRREDPRKAWTEKELKSAIRFLVYKMIQERISR